MTWEHAIRVVANKLKEIRDAKGGSSIGVIGSNTTTNEENYLLQKFARTVLGTNSIDHIRTTDYAAFTRALAGHEHRAASLRDTETAKAILLIGGNPTEEHPLLAWNIRTNFRHHAARLYIATDSPIKLERQARQTLSLPVELKEGLRILHRLPLRRRRGPRRNTKTPNPSAKPSTPKIRSSSSSVRSIAARPSSPSSNGVLPKRTSNSPTLATTPTHAARQTWVSAPICFPAMFRSLLPAFSPKNIRICPPNPARTAPEMLDAACRGDLAALYIVGSDPVTHLWLRPKRAQERLRCRPGYFPYRHRSPG